MNHTTSTTFFQAGGTLEANVPSYITRPADSALLEHIRKGNLCYILTPRQMGKSSLVRRTAERLHQDGMHTATIDLSKLGTQQVDRDQWYMGILQQLTEQLTCAVDLQTWWNEQQHLGPVQRFANFLRDVVLQEIPERVVLFIDEVDSTLSLDFTDDFFAVIRAAYNRRTSNADYKRLSFVLVGVAAPIDLIKDPESTPFNVGQAINLVECSRADAQPLVDELDRVLPSQQGTAIMDRIFYWTHGHPYLMQKICQALVAAPQQEWSEQHIDTLVAHLFFAEKTHNDHNLENIHRAVKDRPDRYKLLNLYKRIHRGESTAEDERSAMQNRLKLIGLVRGDSGKLVVRNKIYQHVFNTTWIKENTPINWNQMVMVGSVAISLVAILFLAWYIPYQREQKLAVLEDTFAKGFERASDPDTKVEYLCELCNIERVETAHRLFYVEQEPSAQLKLVYHMHQKPKQDQAKMATIIECLYPPLPLHAMDDADHKEDLKEAMCEAWCNAKPAHAAQKGRQGKLECDCTSKWEK